MDRSSALDAVREEIQNVSGSHFDPDVVKTFLEVPICELMAGSSRGTDRIKRNIS